MTRPAALPTTEPEIEAFIAAFEVGTLPKERWTHGAHLLGGAWYVHALGEAAATDRMRTAVKRYNLAVGGQNTATSGYHETVTVFWIKALAQLHRTSPAMSRANFATLAVAEFADRKGYVQSFYSFDVVASTEARAVWIEPDLKSL